MASRAELETALINADKAGDTAAARMLAAEIQKTSAAPTQEPPTDWLRKIAIGGRAAFEGAMGLPMMAADALNQGPMRRALGDPTPSPNETLKSGLDKVTYKPETTDERLLSDVVGGATGALGAGGPIKSALGAMTVGAGSGASGGLAREAGASPLMQFLASIGGGLGTQGVMSGTKMIGRGVRNVVDPVLPGGDERAVGRLLTEIAGPKRDELLGALGTKSQVPGLNTNAGQSAVGAGSAEFSALQKIANEIKPTPAAALEASQEAARRAALQTIGQDKAALEAAVLQRGANAKTNYSAAYQQQVRADPELAKIASNPYFKDAIPEAIKMAKAKGINPKTDMTEFYQGVKLVLDDKLRKVGEGALGDSQKKLVNDVKGELVDWLGKKNPLYDKARTQFAAESKPINQMQVGQYLEGKLVGPLETGDRAAVFAGAMDNAAGTIKNSTGQSIYSELGQVLTPQQEKVANAVLSSLKDERTFNDLASKGMSATRKMTGEFNQPVQGVGMVDRAVTVANAIIRRIEGKGTKSTMNTLADVLQDPQRTAALMKNATPAERKSIVDALTQATAATMGQQP